MSSIIQGESKYLPFLIKSKRTGRPLPLNGATFFMHLKQKPDDLIPVIAKKDADFNKILANDGRVSVLLTPSDTNQLAPQTYYGELRITTDSLPPLVYKIKFELKIETTGLPDGLLNEGISLTVADQLTGS
jgi:hypothetical protein